MKFHIREAREQAGYSQKELAQMIGVAQNTFHGYESGKHDPKSDILAKIAECCNVSVDFLLGRKQIAEKASPCSEEAQKLAKDYDELDDHGKRVVRLVADEEKARCQSEAGVEALAQQAAQITRDQGLSERGLDTPASFVKESDAV